jgi:hypothetical protein
MVVLGAVTYAPSPRLVLDSGVYVTVCGASRVVGFAELHLAASPIYHPRAARRSGKN